MEVGTAVTPLIIPFLFIKINQIMFLFKKKKNIFINFDAKK